MLLGPFPAGYSLDCFAFPAEPLFVGPSCFRPGDRVCDREVGDDSVTSAGRQGSPLSSVAAECVLLCYWRVCVWCQCGLSDAA